MASYSREDLQSMLELVRCIEGKQQSQKWAQHTHYLGQAHLVRWKTRQNEGQGLLLSSVSIR